MTRAELKHRIRNGELITCSPALFEELLEEIMSQTTIRDGEPVVLQEAAGSPHARLRAAATGLQGSQGPESRSQEDARPARPQDPATIPAQLRAHYAAHPPSPAPAPAPRHKPFVYDAATVTLSEAILAAARARMVEGTASQELPADAHARLVAAFTR